MSIQAQRALKFATEAHAGQRRKYTDEPYITHPIAVAEIVQMVTADQDVVAAAYLHDVIEDCDVTFGELINQFGFRCARMVFGLTDQSRHKDGNRATRKTIDRMWMADQCGNVQTIKCADLIHNTASIAQFDPKFWAQYRVEKMHLLQSMVRADRVLWDRAWAQCVA